MRNRIAEKEIKQTIDESFLNELRQAGTNAYGTTYFIINDDDRPDLYRLANRPMSWSRFLDNRAIQKSIETNPVFQKAITTNGVLITEGYTLSICFCYQNAVYVRYMPKRLHNLLREYGRERNIYINWPMLQAVAQAHSA